MSEAVELPFFNNYPWLIGPFLYQEVRIFDNQYDGNDKPSKLEFQNVLEYDF